VVHRVMSAVEAAGRFDSTVDLASLVELLPTYGPATPEDLVRWLNARPRVGRVRDGRVGPSDRPELEPDESRHLRARAYCDLAGRLFATDLRATRSWLKFAGVTGSTAYGESREGDDCDLMAIVRAGSVWVFLAYVFLRLRFRSARPGTGLEPVWCFNYTLDEPAAIREFARPQGFLFAREALVTRPLEGEAYYRALLSRAPWLEQEAPRLFARWGRNPAPEPLPPERGAVAIRVLNALLFPAIATYLQLKGLIVNYALRRSDRSELTFRTITRPDRMALVSEKFERLDRLYAPATTVRRRS
jgi:hypothetical protein